MDSQWHQQKNNNTKTEKQKRLVTASKYLWMMKRSDYVCMPDEETG